MLGISLGGRVALEAALTRARGLPRGHRDRAVSAVAAFPVSCWTRRGCIDPRLADWMPLERAWPVLRWLAQTLETVPYLRDDELAQAGARLVYYLSCPATRASFLSAARELALDPATAARILDTAAGARGARRRSCGASAISSSRCASRAPSRGTARRLPQVLLPCVGHWVNGPHHRCLAEAVAAAASTSMRRRACRRCRARRRAAVGAGGASSLRPVRRRDARRRGASRDAAGVRWEGRPWRA